MTKREQFARAAALSLVILSVQTALAQPTTTAGDRRSPAARGSLAQDAARVDALFEEWDKPDSPGCTVGVIRDGEFIYKRGFGMANLEHGVPISPNSVCYIASTSKQFTAMAVFLLAKEGKVSLDADIREYVPELPAYEWPVTIRHLLHHASGIRDYLTLTQYMGLRHEDFFSGEQTLELIARQKSLDFRPGDRSSYSNSGYWLLALIVERRSGMSLAEYARTHIFDPLGMHDTRFRDHHSAIVEGRVQGYSRGNDGRFEINEHVFPTVGPGGVVSTLDDLLLWDRNFYDAQVGGEAIIGQMLTPGRFNSGKRSVEAPGLIVDQYRGLTIVEHSGRGRGFASQLLRFPEQKLSTIVLCNARSAPADQRCFDIADIYLAEQFPRRQSNSSPSQDDAPAVSVPAENLKSLIGTYVVDGDVFEIVIDDGSLSAAMNGGPSRKLCPIGENRFRVVGKSWTLEFQRTDGEKPNAVILNIEGDPDPVIFQVPRTLAESEARDFLGRYYSDELDVVYNVLLRDGRLLIRLDGVNKRQVFRKPLIAFGRNSFTDGMKTVFQFLRNGENAVTGLRLDDPRIRNLRFEKLSVPVADSVGRYFCEDLDMTSAMVSEGGALFVQPGDGSI